MALPKLRKGEQIIGEGEQRQGFFEINGVNVPFTDTKFRIGTHKDQLNKFFIITKRKRWLFRKHPKQVIELFPDLIHEGFAEELPQNLVEKLQDETRQEMNKETGE